MFYSFDGVDGTGKSTQMDLFCKHLREQGHDVVTCRDPGSTPLGERIREILLHSDADTPIDCRAEMLLYMAARAQLVDSVIRPALERGADVVCDRYLLANVVYQAHAGGLDVESTWRVGEIATDGLMPDLVFVLDMPPAAAMERIGREPDRMERQDTAYRERLRVGFLAEARRCPDKIIVINAAQSIEAVHRQIIDVAS